MRRGAALLACRRLLHPLGAAIALRLAERKTAGLVLLADKASQLPDGPLPPPTPSAARCARAARSGGLEARASWRLVRVEVTTIDHAMQAWQAMAELCAAPLLATARPRDDELDGFLGRFGHVVFAADSAAGVEALPRIAREAPPFEARLSTLALRPAGIAAALALAGVAVPPPWAADLDDLASAFDRPGSPSGPLA